MLWKAARSKTPHTHTENRLDCVLQVQIQRLSREPVSLQHREEDIFLGLMLWEIDSCIFYVSAPWLCYL